MLSHTSEDRGRLLLQLVAAFFCLPDTRHPFADKVGDELQGHDIATGKGAGVFGRESSIAPATFRLRKIGATISDLTIFPRQLAPTTGSLCASGSGSTVPW